MKQISKLYTDEFYKQNLEAKKNYMLKTITKPAKLRQDQPIKDMLTGEQCLDTCNYPSKLTSVQEGSILETEEASPPIEETIK